MKNPFQICVGNIVLAEIQPGVIVTAVVDEIEDGIAYLIGDDGEPYCTTIGNCDVTV